MFPHPHFGNMLQPSGRDTRHNVVLVAAAALCWGISGGVGAVLLNEGWGAFLVAFYRGAIGLLFVLAWLALRPHNSGFAHPRLWFWSLIAGLGVAGNFSFYFLSIREGSVAVAATLMYCAPVFVYLVSFALKLERASRLKWIAIVLVMLGIVLLTGIYDTDASDVSPWGVGAGLLAGLAYALFIFGFKYAAPHGSPQSILTIAFAVLVATVVWPADIEQISAVLVSSDWPLFAVVGVLGAGISFIFYIVGLNSTAPAVASILAMIEPVTASIFGIVVLDQSLAGPQWVGMGLILLMVTALGRSSTH